MSLVFGWDGDIDITGNFKKNGTSIENGGSAEKSLFTTISELDLYIGVTIKEICDLMEVGQELNILFAPNGEISDSPRDEDYLTEWLLHIVCIKEGEFLLSINAPTTSYVGAFIDGDDTPVWYESHNMFNSSYYTDLEQLPLGSFSNKSFKTFVSTYLPENSNFYARVSRVKINDLPNEGYLTVIKKTSDQYFASLITDAGDSYTYDLQGEEWLKSLTLYDVGAVNFKNIDDDRGESTTYRTFQEEIDEDEIKDYSQIHFRLIGHTDEDIEEQVWDGKIDKERLFENGTVLKSTWITDRDSFIHLDISYDLETSTLNANLKGDMNGYSYFTLALFGEI